MSCGCNQNPCQCSGVPTAGDSTQCPPRSTTKCDRDTTNNVWVERGDPDAVGICMLDTMTEEQVIYCIERDDRARVDLLRVTSDPRLLELANTIAELPKDNETDRMQALVNKPTSVNAIPFYGLFRGQPPFAQ
jgi:hypothetical protein